MIPDWLLRVEQTVRRRVLFARFFQMFIPPKRLASALGMLLSSAAFATPASSTQPVAKIGVGDPAPALQVASWFKGSPVTKFAPGQIYVVEFWATWCAPCRKSIPHLTELAHKDAGKVTFVGVDVWEHPDKETDASISAQVAPFVTRMGAEMDYNVAADGFQGTVADHWLTAARQDGIPTAFIIGRDGRIAWIGLPLDMDAVLDQVIADQWDITAEQKRDVALEAKSAHRKELEASIMNAMHAHDYNGTLAAVAKAQAELPELRTNPDLISVKLDALVQSDPGAAIQYVQILTRPGGLVNLKPIFVWSIVRIFSENKKDLLTSAECRVIADDCKAMVDVDLTRNPFLFQGYAEILDRAGNAKSAAKYEQKAIDGETAYIESHRSESNASDDSTLQRQKNRLKRFVSENQA